MKIGIIVAMDKELVQLRQILSEEKEMITDDGLRHIFGKVGDKDIIIQKCGIGKVNAAIGTVSMVQHTHPDIVVSTGCAGGASTLLQVTDVVVGSHYTYHDVYCGNEVSYGQFVGMPAIYSAAPHLLDVALHLNCPTPDADNIVLSERCAGFNVLLMPQEGNVYRLTSWRQLAC